MCNDSILIIYMHRWPFCKKPSRYKFSNSPAQLEIRIWIKKKPNPNFLPWLTSNFLKISFFKKLKSFKLKFSAQQEIFEVELVKLLFRKIIVTCKKAFQGLSIVRLYVCDPGYDRSLNLKLLRWPKIFIKKPLKPIFLFSYQHRKKILMFQLFFCLVETAFNSKILIILSGSRH